MQLQSIQAKNDPKKEVKNRVKKSPKNCPKCGSNLVSKNGHRNKIQRYKCQECKTQFQSSLSVSFQNKKLLDEYLFKNNLWVR
jgi:transposase-like protein